MKDKLLVFQSDFGILEGTVSQMHGISAKVDPSLRIFDLSHMIPKFDTWEASYSLYQTCPAWPEETVFVSVIDPGVGSKRKSVVAKTKAGQYIVTPNNGTLTHIHKHVGVAELREIDESVNRVKGSENSHVFHGRDVYAYTGARLASGVISFEEVGPLLDLSEIDSHKTIDPVMYGNKAKGILDVIDPHFGMLWSNIPITFFIEMGIKFNDAIKVTIMHNKNIKYEAQVKYCKTFSDVESGTELVYNNEIGNLAIATNMASFTDKFNILSGIEWTIEIEKL